MSQDTRSRSYHHGDLRAALVEAGVRLAREGGAGALGLRVVTRSVGVTPNAAYRHFADRRALVLAVAAEAQDRLAHAMRDRMDVAGDDAPGADRAARAVRNLRGVGLGYIHFALREPGWFEVAILTRDEADGEGDGPPVTVDDRVAPPYQLLLDALDEMVAAGALTPERRVNAEWVCWSMVHGFADLATRGPLKGQDRAMVDRLAVHVVDTIVDELKS
ncbi:TetR/AcrR family transcriptional regulator [Streptomyces griseocarneus]|uniref:TetR/AcrR family transcriptional regulator n=1 Tax=Streptomyces griseocarneus TaxID=51201 RepID=UPI00167E8CD7|nr:TetR-like C-terminal domain-containing protein [Streptomyces griseocarneus]MBZ6472503.1 WHG domain-containing protein [Streptomyces griseocarneus]GHG45577.1 TetR family transcriptional regulator [Streptomyces griseocarneus]